MTELKYRRQFILSRYKIRCETIKSWDRIELLNDYYLYTHQDLNINRISFGDNEILILGYILDPDNPSYDNIDILNDLCKHIEDFYELQKNCFKYSGRWIIMHSNKKGFYVFNDTCALRQIYYTNVNGNVYMASQPHILADILNIPKSSESSLLNYINSQYYVNQENPWFGDGTEFVDVKHLLPNHFLDINNCRVHRLNEIVKFKETDNIKTIIDRSSDILEGSIDSIVKREKVMLAVTAGLDSRLLLAASKKNSNKISYYVSTKNILSKNHMDIKTPQKLSDKLGLNLSVIENIPKVRKEFIKYLNQNVSRMRLLPKTLTIQYFYDNFPDYTNINGNASGITKNAYGLKLPSNEVITTEYIMELIDCPRDISFVKDNIEEWLSEAKIYCSVNNINIMDLFYWEQRMGNWGAMYQAEQDIAIEEFTPFSNRELISLLLSTDKLKRSEPNYTLYRDIAYNLWPETLSEKINPSDFKTFIINKIKKLLPSKLIVKLKTIRNSKQKEYL